ncbi:MauE/DoxX family redox-associated membrane protein [Dactylosporangium sp. NPDC000555]|uniref:MauE/DoxX family redox-associated membrane protein n=1 Tax=Dactylosporangium sp. NPDC000555 TaxID=3154260 RepID=UPI003328CEF7
MSFAGTALPLTMGILAAMFVASGAPKLRRPFASALAILRFGVLRGIRPWAGRALGGVEVLVGVAVAVLPNPFWPAVAALLLLSVFTGLVVAALARDRSFDCACFGGGEQISSSTPCT